MHRELSSFVSRSCHPLRLGMVPAGELACAEPGMLCKHMGEQYE